MTGSPHDGQPPTGAPQFRQNRWPSPRDAPHRAHLSTRHLYPPARSPVHGPHPPQPQPHRPRRVRHAPLPIACRTPTPRTSASGRQQPIDQLPAHPPGMGVRRGLAGPECDGELQRLPGDCHRHRHRRRHRRGCPDRWENKLPLCCACRSTRCCSDLTSGAVTGPGDANPPTGPAQDLRPGAGPSSPPRVPGHCGSPRNSTAPRHWR